jgi:hypothetical protein
MLKFKSIVRGFRAAALSFKNDGHTVNEQPERPEQRKKNNFSKAGRLIKCSHCESVEFERRSYKLTTTFKEGIWADDATALVCGKCSKIEWFIGDL